MGQSVLHRWFFILSLLPGALLLFALVDWNPAAQESVVQEAAPRQVDFFAVNAKRTQFREDGRLHSELTSPRVEHLLGSEVSLLETPNLLLHQDSAQPWRIQSETAEVSPDGKRVELKGNVRIHLHDEHERDVLVTSSRMTLLPEEQYASTGAAVRIATAQGVSSGIGMQAWLKERRLNLLKTARGQYEAP